MDYLYFRKKFTWIDEDSLISWYNHLRWRVLHKQQLVRSVMKRDDQGFLRSYTAIGDVVALFVVLPIFVRYVQLHDMSIAVFAVLFQVIFKTILRPEYHAALEHKISRPLRYPAGGQVVDLLLCGGQERDLRHRHLCHLQPQHAVPEEPDDKTRWSRWVGMVKIARHTP